MTILFLIILGGLWAAVLVPPLLRARTERKTGAIGDYAHTLGVLKTSNRNVRSMPRAAAALVDGSAHNQSMGKSAMIKKRRRDVFTAMLVTCGVTFLLALVVGSPLVWMLHLICDVALGVYVYLLIQIKEQSARKGLVNNKQHD